MSNDAAEKTSESYVDSDYPGQVTRFPDPAADLVLGVFGFQAATPHSAELARARLRNLATGTAAPSHVEYAGYVDPQGHHCQLALMYWAGRPAYQRWWDRPDVQRWWASHGCGPSDIGVWREIMITGAERHQYASGQTDPAGPAAFMPLEPSSAFGFKGAYRARLSGSADDDFDSYLPVLPHPRPADSQGRRLVVELPENLCFIREGQTWDLCSPQELQIWNESMLPVIDGWVSALRDDPVGTGCLSIRDCREQDSHGAQIDRRSQLAFLLSLRHIEEAARTNPAHLKLMKTFNDMYASLPFAPRMNIWVEVHIPRQDGLAAEYINCHGQTGFLPYFPSTEQR